MKNTKRLPIFGKKRSKSKQQNKKKFSLNIQKKKIWIRKSKKLESIKLTTKEFRTIKKLIKI